MFSHCRRHGIEIKRFVRKRNDQSVQTEEKSLRANVPRGAPLLHWSRSKDRKRDTLCDTSVLEVLRAYKGLGSHRGLVSV